MWDVSLAHLLYFTDFKEFMMTCCLITAYDGGILYLFTRKKFAWNEGNYTECMTSSFSKKILACLLYLAMNVILVTSAILTFVCMSLFSWLQLRDTTVGVMACLSPIVCVMVESFARNGEMHSVKHCLHV